MELKRLTINNFRNLLQIDFCPTAGGNIFYGNNAQGKTALVEAIYLLGHARSFRSAQLPDLLTVGTSSGKISCELLKSGVCHRLELELNKQGKKPVLDGKSLQGIGQFLGILSPVLFSPEEVSLIKGAPAGRRSLLDRAIFQAEAGYLQIARNFSRCLLQRNAVIKAGGSSGELAVWTDRFLLAGSLIREKRIHFLDRLRPLLQETYREICGGCEEIDIIYPHAEGDQKDRLANELKRTRQREITLGQTLVGPHRDDPQFYLDGKQLKAFGSQGQQRSCMLGFKTAQVMDLEQQTGESPVLLLDDMTSELDPQRRETFFSFLLGRSGQFFLTTTDPQLCRRFLAADVTEYRVAAGRLET